MDTFHPFWTLFHKHSFQPFCALKYPSDDEPYMFIYLLSDIVLHSALSIRCCVQFRGTHNFIKRFYSVQYSLKSKQN